MEKLWKNLSELLRGLAMIALVLFIAVLIEAPFPSGNGTPWEPEKMEIIDSYSVADSAVMLARLRERHMGFNEGTYFLEYRKNWITGKQKGTELAIVGDEPYYTAVTTPLAEYAVTVTEDGITVGEVKTGLNWGEFCRAYGIGAMPMLTALAGYYVGKFKNKKEAGEK